MIIFFFPIGSSLYLINKAFLFFARYLVNLHLLVLFLLFEIEILPSFMYEGYRYLEMGEWPNDFFGLRLIFRNTR
jgi:hypothetical protein